MLSVTAHRALVGQGISDKVALITDGVRVSERQVALIWWAY